MLEADLSRAVERAFEGTLTEARMKLFHPLGFMLASPVQSPEEAVDRFTAKPEKRAKPPGRKRVRKPEAIAPEDPAEEGLAEDVALTANYEAANAEPAGVHAFLEDKYDGIRAQLHCADPSEPGRVAIYSRNREDITESFPELQEAFARAPEAAGSPELRSLIFDGEILGWDVEADRALPFSILGQRIGRKRVPDELRRSIPVVFMAFDLMCQSGDLLLPLPLHERRARLESVAAHLAPMATASVETPKAQPNLFGDEGAGTHPRPSKSGVTGSIPRLRISPAQMAETAEGIDGAYRDARRRANEGVMIKSAASPYLPGRRGLAWLKLKRELATLDVVITGAEFGNGRRAHVLSDYTFAVRGPAGELLNVGKAYSGLTDAEIAEMTEWLKAHTLEDNGHFRTVEPLRVLEVAFNNIMRSDRHASGFALRFPRIVRIRDDKPVEEIDSLERVEEIYQSQPDKGGE
jgi:DNA ligase-1